jgi:integrase
MAGLTAAAIEKIKPRASRFERPDGVPGLYLVVQPNGNKSWALRFRSPVERGPDGQRKAKKLTLGRYATGAGNGEARIGQPLTLTQARKLATATAEDIQRGIDPTHVRREEKAAAKAEAMTDNTVDAAMVEFLRRYKGRKRQGLRESTRRLAGHYLGLKPDPKSASNWIKTGAGVLGKWSGRPLASIAKRDAITLLDSLKDGGHGVTANRTLTVLKTFFTWCMKTDLATASPVALLDAVAEEKSRERTLSDAELAALWKAADSEGFPFGRFVQMLILTGARRDEMREAPWSEFDLKHNVWTLPASRSKNGREHLVPLSALAVGILEKLPRIGKGTLLFTSTGTTPIHGHGKVKSRLDNAMQAALRKTDPEAKIERWTLHDLRRTLATGLQALKFPVEVIEECLNHRSGTRSGVAGVYARHRYLAEKAAAFEAWSLHVAELVKQ